MNQNPVFKTLLNLCLVLCAGCASVLDGGDKPIHLNSNPPGAKVSIYDKKGKFLLTQTTPTIAVVPRCRGFWSPEDYRLVFELPGYYAAETHVCSMLDGWYLGNLLFVPTGLLGLVVIDPATGYCYTLRPRDLTLNLIAVDSSLTPDQVKAAQEKANPPAPFPVSSYNRGHR